MSDSRRTGNEQKVIERDIKLTAAKPKRKRRNNKKPKIANSSAPEVTSQNETRVQIDTNAPSTSREVDIVIRETVENLSTPEIAVSGGETREQTVSSEGQEQSPTEGDNLVVVVDEQTSKKTYSIEFMLELSSSPLSQIDPEYLKNFEEIRVTKPDAADEGPSTANGIDSNPGPSQRAATNNYGYPRRQNDNHGGFERPLYFNRYNAREASQMDSGPGPQYNNNACPRYFNANRSGFNQNDYFNPQGARPGASQTDSISGPQYNGYARRYNDNHNNNDNRNNNFNPYNVQAMSPETIQLRPCYGNNNIRGHPQVYGQNNNEHVNNFDFASRHRRDNGNRSSYNNSNNNNNGYYNGSYRNYARNNFDNDSNGFQTNNAQEQNAGAAATYNPEKKKVIHFSLARTGVVELNTSKNAWVPSCRKEQKSTNAAEVPIEEIQKKVRSILNKITPDNMVELTATIIELPITTYACLVKIIDLLFQKAIDEPNFTPQYAYISLEMKNIEVMSDDGTTKKSFQRLIIEKCQDTFETVSIQEKDEADKLSEIESCKDQDLKRELQAKYDENERIQRKRSVGNCRFMCELFKVDLLKTRVIDMCVSHLLRMPKEEPLECLCNILKHIGSRLNPKNTFEKLQELASINYRPKIPSRIRFMILDTIDLKNNNWVPRSTVIKPKTLKEIENEFSAASWDSSKTVTKPKTLKEIENEFSAAPWNSITVTKPKTLKEIENEFSAAPWCSKTVSGFNAKPETRVNATTNVQQINAPTIAVEPTTSSVSVNALKINAPTIAVEPTTSSVSANAQKVNVESSKAQIVENRSLPNPPPQLEDSVIQTVVKSMTAVNQVTSSEKLTSHISTVDRLEETLDVLFETAISEPEKIPLLAETCSSLKRIVLRVDGKGSVHVSFKKQLATRCQKILQTRSSDAENSYTMISELFNKKLVPLNLMVEFINDIITDRSFIEILCRLLKIIGVEIERSYSLKYTMKRLAKTAEGSISPACKSEIKNLIQLHSNKWRSPVDSFFNKPLENTKQKKGRGGGKNPVKK